MKRRRKRNKDLPCYKPLNTGAYFDPDAELRAQCYSGMDIDWVMKDIKIKYAEAQKHRDRSAILGIVSIIFFASLRTIAVRYIDSSFWKIFLFIIGVCVLGLAMYLERMIDIKAKTLEDYFYIITKTCYEMKNKEKHNTLLEKRNEEYYEQIKRLYKEIDLLKENTETQSNLGDTGEA